MSSTASAASAASGLQSEYSFKFLDFKLYFGDSFFGVLVGVVGGTFFSSNFVGVGVALFSSAATKSTLTSILAPKVLLPLG